MLLVAILNSLCLYFDDLPNRSLLTKRQKHLRSNESSPSSSTTLFICLSFCNIKVYHVTHMWGDLEVCTLEIVIYHYALQPTYEDWDQALVSFRELRRQAIQWTFHQHHHQQQSIMSGKKKLLNATHTRINSLIKMLIFRSFFLYVIILTKGAYSYIMFDEKNQNLVTIMFSCPKNLNTIVLNLITLETWKLCKTSWLMHLNNLILCEEVGFKEPTKNIVSKTVEWRATPRRKLHANLKNFD
jgi:hypothetical protein